jgi:hypothetical protein
MSEAAAEGSGAASGLSGGSLLVVDLELVHTQPLHLKLLDIEPPDDRTPDRQTPDGQGADSTSPERCRPDRDRADRKRADASRAELLHATTGLWGPPEWALEPVHGRSSFGERPQGRCDGEPGPASGQPATGPH